MDVYLSLAITVSALASIAAAVFAFRAGSTSGQAAAFAQFADIVRRENELARQAADQNAVLLRQELSGSLQSGTKTIDDHIAAMGLKLDSDIARMGGDATVGRDALRQQIQQRLDEAANAQATAAATLRQEVVATLQQISISTGEFLRQIGEQQQQRLDTVALELRALTETNTAGQETLRQTIQNRLDAIREENSAKLEQMRQTVDEKLQSTLEQRLGDSFNIVVEQLKRVHEGLGEMQTLATGVGDLKKVLSNVSVRGTLAEVQLGALLEQFLSPEQFVRNATVKDGTLERVEFAVKLPGRGVDGPVLLPIDAKFPKEDYERLIAAADQADADGVADARKALEATVRACAKTISEKYINSPRTTDFAILFLPTEGLYAEVLRRPGFFEQLQRDFHVTMTGPVTLTALLNALQMGFRSVAIEKRSSEVWEVLGAVRTEFDKYNKVVEKLAKNLSTAANSVDELGKRTRVMGAKLKNVETVDGPSGQNLLGLSATTLPLRDDDEEDVAPVAAE